MYKNVYYSPEDFGLKMAGQFDLSEPDYSFDMCVVWEDKRGQYWVGMDSGCSCPSPFEEVTDVNELDGPYEVDGLRERLEYITEERSGSGYYGYSKAELKKSASYILSGLE